MHLCNSIDRVTMYLCNNNVITCIQPFFTLIYHLILYDIELI